MYQSDAGDRRQAPRRLVYLEVRIRASYLLLDSQAFVAEPSDRPLVLYGTACELSLSGVLLIIPSVSLDPRCCELGLTVLLTIFLPDGQIDLEVLPLRCEMTDITKPYEVYVLATKLVSVRDEHRTRLRQYVENNP